MVPKTSLNADGCVVVDRARRRLADSLSERFKHRAPSLEMYAAMIRDISSLNGWMVTGRWGQQAITWKVGMLSTDMVGRFWLSQMRRQISWYTKFQHGSSASKSPHSSPGWKAPKNLHHQPGSWEGC